MKLIESIATYTGESYVKIKKVLSDQVKEIIAKMIVNPDLMDFVDPAL